MLLSWAGCLCNGDLPAGRATGLCLGQRAAALVRNHSGVRSVQTAAPILGERWVEIAGPCWVREDGLLEDGCSAFSHLCRGCSTTGLHPEPSSLTFEPLH